MSWSPGTARASSLARLGLRPRRLLAKTARPLTALEAADALGKSQAARMLLARMKQAGLIRHSLGRYSNHLPTPQEGG